MADVKEAVEFMRQVGDAESENRVLGLEDLKFRYGDQWPQYAVASRGLERPQLTINEVDSYIRQVTNEQRKQRPRIKVDAVDNFADPKIAKIITGLTRHVEVNSDADHAYDTAFDFAATIGWGYIRVRTDYIAEDSFDQDCFIDTVTNPFSVYFDNNSKLPDGSDAEKALITDLMSKAAFKKKYPGADPVSFQDRVTGDSDPDWVTQQDIRLAEFFYVDRQADKLVMLTDGTILWASELGQIKSLLVQAGIGVKGERDSFKRVVKWCKQTAFDILEEKTLPGRWIPIVPVYWTQVQIDGKLLRQGLVRPAKDPQRMVNFWQTSITESIALAPKAKWLIAEGADEGHEREFANANLSAAPTLHYKTTGVDGREIPAPQRIAPEPPPSGSIEAAFLANQNLQRVMGIFDPAVRSEEPKSGKAIMAEQGQSENSNFHGYDNLTRSIKQVGRILLSYFPVVYDTQRVMRIIGDDGRSELITINEKTQAQDDTGAAIEKVLNDVRIGTYDVVMDTGPGFDTKRQQGVESMMALMNTPIGEKVAQVGDDLVVRQMDFNGSDVLADRLAAANPMAQIDEKDDVPPMVQMMVKGLQQQLQQAGQVIQQLQTEIKYRAGIEQMKQDGETQREHMRTTVKAHDVNERNLSMQHSVEVKAMSAQSVEEIRGLVTLLSKKLDTAQFEREIEREDAQLQAKANENASAAA